MIVVTGSARLGALLQVTRTVPIVFTIVPIRSAPALIDSLAQPGGNATGFVQFEYGLSGKWPELLKEVAPAVTRVGVLREPGLTAAIAQLGCRSSRWRRRCASSRFRSMCAIAGAIERAIMVLRDPRMTGWSSRRVR